MFVSFYRIIKFAFQDFWRNFWLSFITITIMVLTLLSINLLIVLSSLGEAAISSVQEKIDISINFKPEASANKIEEIKNELADLAGVVEIQYLSREEVLANFKETHQAEPEILATLKAIGKNPLGSTLIIKAQGLEYYPNILKVLEDPQYIPKEIVENKNYEDHEVVISRINSIANRAKEVGVIISAIFVIITILIVFNTIRVAIYTHRAEIGIMKLVGANNFFTRAPFIIESIYFSLLAVILTAAILYPVLNVIQPYLASFFQGVDFNIVNFFRDHWLIIFGWEFLILAVLNVLSSAVAVGKYLHV